MQGLEAHKYKSTIDCVQQLLKNEGPMAFYKGVGPRLTRVCLEVGITMSLYGEIVKVLDKVCVASGRENGAFRNLAAGTD
jgi:solute carrier family 25 citrate transporter 1